MKRCADVLLYACHFADCCFSEVAGESQISICNDPLWDSKPGKEMLKVEVRNALTIYGFVAKQELCGFGTSLIYNGENGIICV